jgi:hypothetical protein
VFVASRPGSIEGDTRGHGLLSASTQFGPELRPRMRQALGWVLPIFCPHGLK